MDVMMKMFQEKFVTIEERRLASLVKQKGGDAVFNDEQVMMELWTEEASISASAGNERHRSTENFDPVEIQREIREQPAEAIERNEKTFYGHFRVQMRWIQDDINRAFERQEHRVISAINEGPHDRILDPVRIPVRSQSSG